MANGICSDQMINLHNTVTWESSTWDIVRKLNMQPHNTINNSSKKQNALSAYNAKKHQDEHSTYNCTVYWATVSTGAVLAGVGAGLSVCQSAAHMKTGLRPCSVFTLQQKNPAPPDYAHILSLLQEEPDSHAGMQIRSEVPP